MTSPGTSGNVEGPGIVSAFRAWQTARSGVPVTWRVSGDPIAGDGLPQRDDVLIPADGQAVAGLSVLLTHLAPHLVRPIRMVVPAAPSGGFLARLFGGGGTAAAKLDPADPLISARFRPMYRAYRVEAAVLIDVPRLIICLARDCVAHGGEIVQGPPPRNDPDADQPGEPAFRSSIVVDRPWREDLGYLDSMADGQVVLLPLSGDHLFADCSFPERPEGDARAAMTRVLDDLLVRPPPASQFRFGQGADGRAQRRTGAVALQPLAAGPADLPEPLIDGRLDGGYGMFANRLAATWSHLDAAYIRTLMSRHGAATPEVLGQVHRDADLGEDFGGGLRAQEVRWMIDHEWARTAEDVFLRRGPFQYNGTDFSRLQDWMDRHGPVV